MDSPFNTLKSLHKYFMRRTTGLQLSLFDIPVKKFFTPSIKEKELAPPVIKRKKRVRKGPSDKLLKSIWLRLRQQYFPNRPDLDFYTVVWSSRRQKRTLASCSTASHKVRVARELNYPQHTVWLEPLLYHEMCHAYLGNQVDRWHGKEFNKLERRHPLCKSLNAWIKSGGWTTAVRSDRAKRAHQERRLCG